MTQTATEIRAGEAGLSPPALAGLEVESGLWVVAHTRSRQEKAVAEVLGAAGIEHFLPLVRRVRYYGHRRRAVEAPLFPSYVFLRGTREEAMFVADCGRVAHLLRVTDQERFANELQQIRAALEHGAELDPYPFLRVGARVRVRSGPFKGVEGLVENRLKQDRLVLQIAALGRATGLEIDASLLEPLD